MKKVKVKNLNNEVLQFVHFEDEQTLKEWVEMLEKSGWQELKPEREEIIFDETGKELEVIKHPAEFTVEIEDITAEVEAKKLADEAKAKKKKERIQSLKAINYTSVDTIAELKAIVKMLVEKELDEA